MVCQKIRPHAPGMQGGPQTTVALLSRHHLLHFGLQQVMKSEGWIRFHSPTVAGMNTDELILHQSPDIIIIDSEIARDVSPVINRIKASHTMIKLILLCNMDEAEHSRQRLSLGIDAIVLKLLTLGRPWPFVAQYDSLRYIDRRPLSKYRMC